MLFLPVSVLSLTVLLAIPLFPFPLVTEAASKTCECGDLLRVVLLGELKPVDSIGKNGSDNTGDDDNDSFSVLMAAI